MSLTSLMQSLQNCPCGRTHTTRLRAVKIEEGCLQNAARFLSENGFTQHILVVTEQCALDAANGILDVLQYGGFAIDLYIYETPCTANEHAVERICAACRPVDGILSIGTGTVSDVCRRAALIEDKDFAIFATAPSMDGFASDTAPILQNGFKISLPARQPSVIIADTSILAAAPAVLKSAGYGDMLGKYIALAEWRIAHVLTGEYYCASVAELVRSALRDVVALTDHIAENDPQTAGVLMRSLVTTGLAMQLCGFSRPAGGAEHLVSHFWETRQLERGERTDCHGRKVGVASCLIARLYHAVIRQADPARFCADATDWARVFDVYGETFAPAVRDCCFPSVLEDVTPVRLRAHWNEICQIVCEEIPMPDDLDDLLRRADGARTPDDVGVTEALALQGLEFHPYMRRRIVLSRLLPMLGMTIDYRAALHKEHQTHS